MDDGVIWGFPEIGVLFGVLLRGSLFSFGVEKGVPLLWEIPILTVWLAHGGRKACANAGAFRRALIVFARMRKDGALY